MKIAEIRELTLPELEERLAAVEREYEQRRVNHAVSPLDNPSEITAQRRTIARMKTILNERKN